MAVARDMRRCAVQALYQFDASGSEDPEAVRKTLESSPGTDRTRNEGFRLATGAWGQREQADAELAPYTPEWPTHRQPVIDRSILRLAWYEIVEAGTPPKVVINEAVELAREFSTEKSPLFINGVLDRFYKGRLPGEENDDDSAGDEAMREHEEHPPPGSYSH